MTVTGCAVTFSDWPSKDGASGGAGIGGASGETDGSSAGDDDGTAGTIAASGGRDVGGSTDEGGADSVGASGAGTPAGASATAGSISAGGEPAAGSTAAGGNHADGGSDGAVAGGVSSAGEANTAGGMTEGGTTGVGGDATGGTTSTGGSATGGTTSTGGQTSPPACVRFVDVDAASGGNGLTWARAFRTVGEATASAATARPCEVWVAEGTYYTYVSSPSDSVRISDGVSVYGGFSGAETVRADRNWQNHVTTLSGYSSNDSSRVYHVVVAAGNSTLDGFTITGGNASIAPDDSGGGLVAENTSTVVRNWHFIGNYALKPGGGAYFAGGTPTVEDATFSANDAGDSGGALQMNASGLVSRCAIYENSSGNDSGGIAIALAGPTVQNSVFYRNIAYDFSGGLGVVQSSSGTKVLNNTFYANDAPHGGGGFSVNADVAIAANNLAFDNTGEYGPNILVFTDRTASSHHNCGNGGMFGTDNIDADPGLVAPASGDFRLLPSSPCIDQGDDTLAPAEDMTLGSRIDVPDVGVSVSDIGALEYRP